MPVSTFGMPGIAGTRSAVGPDLLAARYPVYPFNPAQDKDLQSFLSRMNPYTNGTGLAPTYADLQAGGNWFNSNLNAARPGGQSFLQLPSSIYGPPGGVAAPPPNPFETQRSVKNPEIESAVNAILKNVVGLSSNPNQRQGVVQGYTKSGALQGRIDTAGNQLDVDVNNVNQSIADFTKQFLAGQGAAQGRADQEVGAIGEFYDGTMDSRLKNIRDRQRLLAEQEVQRKVGAAMRARSLGEMAGRPNSYLDAQLGNTVANASLANQAVLAAQERDDLKYGKGEQTRLAGQRNAIMDAVINRLLTPAQARSQFSQANLGQLGQLANLEGANNLYQYTTPQQLLQEQLGLLGGVTNLDQANNFYGLRAPMNQFQDSSGYLPVGIPPIVNPGSGVAPQDFSGIIAQILGGMGGAGAGGAPAGGSGYYNPAGGYGYDQQPTGEYNITGQYPYGMQTLPGGQVNPMYVPGYDRNRVARLQQYYE